MKKVLILIHKKPISPEGNNWEPFRQSVVDALQLQDVQVDIEALRELVFETGESGMKIHNPDRDLSLLDYDFVYFRLVRDQKSRMGACAQYLQLHDIPYVDSMRRPGSYSKLSSEFMRSANGIPTVATYCTDPTKFLRYAQDSPPFQYPFILKDADGKRGRKNFKITSYDELSEAFSEYQDTEFIAQPFIENDGDYRCLVFGGKVRLIIKRKATAGSHLNNTSQGGTSELVEINTFSSSVLNDVAKAAAIENIEIAGVDLIFDKITGRHYILEVNSSPQLMTGAFPDKKLSAFAEYLKETL